jgi:hypothetical protein
MSFLLNRKAAELVSSSKNEFLTDRSRVAVELNETVKEKHVETDTELFAQALHKDSSKMTFEKSSKRHDSRQHASVRANLSDKNYCQNNSIR